MAKTKLIRDPNLATGQARAPAPIRAMFRVAGMLAPEAVGQYVGRKMFRPRRSEKPVTIPFPNFGAEKIPATHLDRPLNVHAWGTGSKTVLLVHGWEGDITDMSEFVMPLLKQRVRVVALELPAHGDSVHADTDVHDAAAAIRAAVSSIGALHGIIAHSLGAAAATVYLSENPLWASRLVLIAPGGDLGLDIQCLCKALSLPKRACTALIRYVSARYGRPIEQCSTAIAAKAVHIPTLIFHDRADRITPFSEAEEISRSFAQARLVPTSQLGHRRILRDPLVVSRAVDFLMTGATSIDMEELLDEVA